MSLHGDFVMEKRLLTMKQVQERIPFARAHIDRLVHDPKYAHLGFPKPVKIGFRVFWLEQTVIDWIDRVTESQSP